MRKAVIDVGSNSLILVVEEYDGVIWRPVVERTAVTSLGEGTKSTGLLSEPGIARSLEALSSMFCQARALEVDSVQAAATMAVRIADNRDEFLRRAAGQDTPVSILSGDDEARLGFEAIAGDPTFNYVDRLTIVDPGGQSTELVTAQKEGDAWITCFRRSYPVGTLGLRSTLLQDESPQPPDMLRASAFIDDTIGLGYLRDEAGVVVVLGATGTNLVSIRDRMAEWNPVAVHGGTLRYEEVSKAVGSLMRLTDAGRAGLVGIEPGREKTIHIGALILERFLFATGAPGCRVSVRGWRHALLESKA